MGDIVLSEHWDTSIKYAGGDHDDQGYFAGRKREVELLANDIARKNEGSILVRGYPGVGKTSLVLQALSEVDEENIIPVFLSGPDMVEENQLSPSSMMSHLARRLYVYTRDEDLDEINRSVETFYLKSVSESKDILVEELEEIEEEEVASEYELSTDLDLWQIFGKVAAYSLPFVAGALSTETTIVQANPILGPIIAAILIIPAHFVYRRISRESELRRLTKQAESVYEKDNTLGNLKFDLNEIHRDLGGKRIIYIFDELDKVGLDEAKGVLEFFKDFFTSSNALFIFVGGEDFKPEEFTEARDSHVLRPRSYTYFNSRYFIARPRREDLFQYLQEITEATNLSDEELEETYSALCFSAKNDFFDLKTQIKDRIEDFQEYSPILNHRHSDKALADFYQVISLFEEKYSTDPSKWEENEQIARTLFDIAFEVREGRIGQKFEDPSGFSLVNQLVRDFHQLLYRHGVLDLQNSEMKEVGGGASFSVSTYILRRKDMTSVPETISEPTEFEREFVQRFENYCHYSLPLINMLRSTGGQEELTLNDVLNQPDRYLEKLTSIGLDSVRELSDHRKVYKKINDRDNQDLSRDQVQELSDQLESLIDNFILDEGLESFARAYDRVKMEPTSKLCRLSELPDEKYPGFLEQYEEGDPLVISYESRYYGVKRIAIFSNKHVLNDENIPPSIRNDDKYTLISSPEGSRRGGRFV